MYKTAANCSKCGALINNHFLYNGICLWCKRKLRI